MYTAAVAADGRHIEIYDEHGGYISRLCVTSSGNIVGSPMVTSNTISVPIEERGNRYLVVYDAKTLGYLFRRCVN